MDNVQAYDAYDARADTINVDEITYDSRNRIILRRLQRNNADENNNELYIQNEHDDDEDEEGCTDYCPEGANDMGWLGYFIGKNQHLWELVINSFTPTSGSSLRDVIALFLRGVNCNTSIQEIFFRNMDLLGGEMFTMLGIFFKKNHNLTKIVITDCDFGDDGARLFALAIGSSTNKSLQHLVLVDSNISEEEMVDIITSLSMHPQLQELNLYGNRLRKNGCVALATLLQCSTKELQRLSISRNEINDEGIDVLVPALATCNRLKILYLADSPSITTKGWQSLASILEAPNSNLRKLYIAQNNIDDEVVASFSDALANNRTLNTLCLDSNPSITAKGWEAVSKVLCDTSSVNTTFLSNHTLYDLGDEGYGNGIIGPLLDLNERDDKKEIATIKILKTHEDFDMLPFFEWEFKCLPMVLGWLERASEFEMPEDFEPNIEPRKLSTIYQFVRGLPLLYVETRLRKELEDIKAKEKQMEEKLQEIKQRKQSIMRKLGQKSESC